MYYRECQYTKSVEVLKILPLDFTFWLYFCYEDTALCNHIQTDLENSSMKIVNEKYSWYVHGPFISYNNHESCLHRTEQGWLLKRGLQKHDSNDGCRQIWKTQLWRVPDSLGCHSILEGMWKYPAIFPPWQKVGRLSTCTYLWFM